MKHCLATCSYQITFAKTWLYVRRLGRPYSSPAAAAASPTALVPFATAAAGRSAAALGPAVLGRLRLAFAARVADTCTMDFAATFWLFVV